MKSAIRSWLNSYIAAPLIFAVSYLIFLTLRVRVYGEEAYKQSHNSNCILALWHRNLIYFPYMYRGQSKWRVLVSPSADGNILAAILSLYQLTPVRGSAYKNPKSSFLSLARAARGGSSVAVAADGSRGPARKAQAGAVLLAKTSSLPVIPIAWDCKCKIVLSSWDKAIMPLPFSRINICTGEPMSISKKASTKQIEEATAKLEDELERLSEEAGRF